MYNFLQEATGLNSKELEQDEVQIEANDPWWEKEEECECFEIEEDKEDPCAHIWDVDFPEVTLWLDNDTMDNLEELTPYQIDNIASYLTKLEEFTEIKFPNYTYNTPFDELPFLYWETNENGSVTFSIDVEDLNDYLKEEC